jgi:uncharacterized protein (TIGR02996 family)
MKQSSLQESLERALVENPDDLAAHSAYADYLMEQGDPRGEFIQVQLALEDERRTPGEREELRNREQTLLRQHAREWLGDAGRFLHGDWSGPDKPYHYQFWRGWLDLVRVLLAPGYLEGSHSAILASLVRSPQARLLRRLEVVYDMRFHPFDFDEHLAGPSRAMTHKDREHEQAGRLLSLLIDSPGLTNLRACKVGFSDTGDQLGHSTMIEPFEDCDTDGLIRLLEHRPRLEELYLNTHLRNIERLFAHPVLGQLRRLQYYYGSDYLSNRPGTSYPLSVLAKNAALTRLTHLRLHPGRDTTIDLEELDAILRSRHLPSLTHLQVHMTTFGDEGCRAIVRSGILRRLRSLDLGYGNMTDAGAQILAECPDLKDFDLLDVSRNGLTEQGIAALRTVGIRCLVADDQHDLGEDDYLYEVDFE